MPSVWAPGASSPIHKFTTPTFRFNGTTLDPPYRNDRVPDPSDPDRLMDSASPIPFGSAAALDFFTLHHGYGMFFPKPETKQYFRPVTEPFPSLPPDPDYKEGFKMLVGVRGFGVMIWTCLQQLVQEDVFDLWLTFARSKEAREGKIPVCHLGVDEVDSKTRNSTYTKITLAPFSHMVRNPVIWGPPLIDLNKAAAMAALEIPDDRPTRPATIDQVHQERLAQSRLTPTKSRDPRYNVTHADTKASTKPDTPDERPGFSKLLDDEIPW